MSWNWLSIAFLDILDQYGFKKICKTFYKMAAGAHFGCQKFMFFVRFFGHFRSIQNFIWFLFFLQNLRCRPIWMSEIHFFDRIFCHLRSIRNFILFWISYKMTTGGHFGCSKITFDCISGHFILIGHFGCMNSLSITLWNSSKIFGWVMHVSSLKNVV